MAATTDSRRRRLLALLALLAAPLAARSADEDWPTDRHAWRQEVPPGWPIEIENPHGDVLLRAVERAGFEGSALFQHHPEDRRPIEVEPRCEQGRCRLAVHLPASELDAGAPIEWRRRRVDLTVEVPASSPLAVRTGDGAIRATLAAPRWREPVELATVSGELELAIAADADLAVEIDTQGAIATDLSLTVERTGLLRKRARALVGAGTLAVHLSSHQGDVILRLDEGEPSGAPPAIEDWSIERLERAVPLAAGSALAIENLYGDLRVRPHDRPEALLVGQAQRHRDDPRASEIAVEESSGRTAIRVVEPAADPAAPPAWSRRRVDLARLVPPAATLAARSDRGLIEIKGHQGAVHARSRQGDLALRVGGPVDLRAERGSIAVVLQGAGWSHPSRLETVAGDLSVSFSAGADADLVVEARGPVTTDFTIDLERLPAGRRRGRVRLGRGGALVELSSGEGSLELLQLPELPQR